MIEEARRILERATRVVSFSGAGLSAESGVPTFRDAGKGLWSKHDPMVLASPEGFEADPGLVIDWYAWRRREIARAQPNPAHQALAATGWAHVTQNVDDLLHRCGAQDVVQLHGRIDYDRCHRRCGHREAVDMADPPPLRRCPGCGARLRPDVVWFGEALDPGRWSEAERACRAADVMLVVGTSAVVHPAAGLIGTARGAGAKIIVVNTQRSEASAVADVELIGKAGEVVPGLVSDL